MAGLDAENFGWYTDPQRVKDVALVQSGTVSIGPYGRLGGPGLRFSGNPDDEYQRSPAQAPQGNTAIIHDDVRLSALPDSTKSLIKIYDGLSVQVSLDVRSDGKVEAFRGSGGSKASLGAASTYVMPTGRHVRLGLKVELADAGGTVTVQVFDAGDETPQSVLTLTGLDTQATPNASWTRYALCAATTGTTDHGNVVVQDASGASSNDLETAPHEVRYLPFNGAGAHSEFSRSAGVQQHATVDDGTPDDDLTYNYTDTEGAKDVLHVADTPAPDKAMAFALVALVAKGAAATIERLAHVIRQSSGLLTYGPTLTPTSTYLAYLHPVQTLPDGEPFAPGEGDPANAKAVQFNGAQYGYAWPVEESEALLVAMASSFPTVVPTGQGRGGGRPRGTTGSVGPM